MNCRACLVSALALTFIAVPVAAQDIGARGFFTAGNITFQAQDSFDAVLGSPSGPVIGGGGQVLLPFGIYVEVAGSRFKQDGERVFVGPGNEVFPLGIPVEVTITPIEVTGGYRFTRWQRIVPYGGIGFSSYGYTETSEFADAEENVDERFSGFHIVGGAEYLALGWLGIGGEIAWSSIADAIGQGGASAAFNENNLGGTMLRLKITVGR